jgi:hypothetical protein
MKRPDRKQAGTTTEETLDAKVEKQLARDAKVFPAAIDVIRKFLKLGRKDATPDDARKIADAWAEPKNRFEAVEAAKEWVAKHLPAQTTRQGRAKLDDFEQLSLFPAELKEFACRAYIVSLPDGSEQSRCLYEMTKEQRQSVRDTFVGQHKAFAKSIRSHDKLEREFASLGVPDDRAPSDFLPRKTMSDAAD